MPSVCTVHIEHKPKPYPRREARTATRAFHQAIRRPLAYSFLANFAPPQNRESAVIAGCETARFALGRGQLGASRRSRRCPQGGGMRSARYPSVVRGCDIRRLAGGESCGVVASCVAPGRGREGGDRRRSCHRDKDGEAEQDHRNLSVFVYEVQVLFPFAVLSFSLLFSSPDMPFPVLAMFAGLCAILCCCLPCCVCFVRSGRVQLHRCIAGYRCNCSPSCSVCLL